MRLSVTIEMPDGELQTLLGLLRHWEGGRPEIAMVITGEGTQLKTEEVEQVLRSIDPPLPYVRTIPLPTEDAHGHAP